MTIRSSSEILLKDLWWPYCSLAPCNKAGTACRATARPREKGWALCRPASVLRLEQVELDELTKVCALGKGAYGQVCLVEDSA